MNTFLCPVTGEQVTKLSLELGGHAPVLVFDDVDLERAVEGTLIARFRNTGQSCIAANRVYVPRPHYEAFVARLVERAKQLKVGEAFEPDVEVGPLIDEAALARTLVHIANARQRGASVCCGGQRYAATPYVFFWSPPY